MVNGTTYNTSGQFTQFFTNSVGCDSTLTINVTINQASFATISRTGCGLVMVNGTAYNTSGQFNQMLTNTNGCDSTLTINVTINQATSSNQTIDLCIGGTVVVGGQTFNNPGTFVVTTTNSKGCDSVINLSINSTGQPCVVGPLRTRYVSLNGSNLNNDCLDSNATCQTIQYAIDVAVAGDTIMVFKGLYNLSAPQLVTKSLTIRGQKYRVSAVNRATSFAQFQHEALLRSSGTIFLLSNQVADIVIDGFTLEPSNNANSQSLIQVTRNPNLRIRNNIFGATNMGRIHNGNFVGGVMNDYLVAENNWLLSLNSGKIAFNLSGGTNIIIRNNRHRVFATGHFLYTQGSENLLIENNTIDRNQTSLRLGGADGLASRAVRNVQVIGNNFTSTNDVVIINNSLNEQVVFEHNTISSPSVNAAAIRINNGFINTSGTRFNRNRIFTAASDPNKDYVIYNGNQLNFTCNYWGKPQYAQFEFFVDDAVLSNSINIFPYLNSNTSMASGNGFYPPSTNCIGTNQNPLEGAENVLVIPTSLSLEIFPNPANQYTLLSLSAPEVKYLMVIQYLSGKVLLDKVLNQQENGAALVETIGLDQLAGGMYLVTVTGNEEVLTKKLVVQH
jgi:hypothetical protein